MWLGLDGVDWRKLKEYALRSSTAVYFSQKTRLLVT
jgi:hypothetical protein